ncbi:hypothetical protein LuPra_00438 [Luteitalea pratensis]|uniref:Uncharacterized protein n=1 Tax=Luteitalea pratensis TaxID=1855912 RepID=A0A143PFH5_LUTPR|nr:hypothetical protein LuPra_00438 [Luteitalea pratensis]
MDRCAQALVLVGLHGSRLRAVAEVNLSSWRERGAVLAAGIEHKVFRQGFLGPFVLEQAGSVVASAEKSSAFRKTVQIEHHGRHYTLKPRSCWRREMVLYEGDRELGSIAPSNWLVRDARVSLPDDLSMALRLFVVWLTLLLWKRDSDAGAAAAAG